MTDEATQDKGVSKDYRQQMLDEINKRRLDEMKEELEDDPEAVMEERAERLKEELAKQGEDPDEEGEVDEPEESPEELEEEAPQEDDPEPPVYLKDGEWYTRQKVNGIEQEVPFSKVLSTAQKHEAADARLQEAHQRGQQLQAYERQLREYEQSLQQIQPSSAKDVDDLKSLIKEQREALLDGDDELYEELTEKLLRRQTTTSPVDPRQLENIAQRTALQTFQQLEQQRQIRDADAYFAREFSDIQNDPALWSVAIQYVDQVRKENPTLNPMSLVQEAGNRTRHWLSQKTGNTLREQTNSQKRKMSATRGASAKTPSKPKPKAQTREDYINSMREARANI